MVTVGGLAGPGVRVVLIGTASHRPDSRLPDVPAAATSVRDLAACLIDRCGVDQSNITVLVDPEQPLEIADAVDAAARDAQQALVIWYVGHGLVDDRNELYLATRASQDAQGSLIGYRAYPYAEIRQALRHCPAPAIVIVLDCCYAGRATVASPAGFDAALASTGIRGSYLLTSTARHEQALAPEGARHTVFTGAAIDLLTGGDPVGGPAIRLEDLYRHLRRTLPAHGGPVPKRWAVDGIGDLVLTPNPGFRPRRPSSPARAPLPDGVEARPDSAEARSDGAEARPDGAEATSGPDRPVAVCPWPGLAAYTPSDADWFRGRADLTDTLVATTSRRAGPGGGPVIVVGASGAGKSSLLAAGLLPAVAAGRLAVPGSASWPALILTPGADPLATLAARLGPLAGVEETQARQILDSGPDGLVRLVRRFLHARTDDHLRTGDSTGPTDDDDSGGGDRLVLLVDQFEELFTLCDDEPARTAFIDALCTAASEAGGHEEPGPPGPAAVVVLAVRADVYGRCAHYPPLRAALTDGQVLAAPMTPANLREAIEEPALTVGVAWEDGVVDLILRDLGHRALSSPAASLPLLSHTLWETWRRSDRRTLTFADYHDAGRIDGAITRTAETSYAALDPGAQDAARTLLLRMVRIRPDGTATRRALHRDNQPDTPATRTALDALAAARLISLDHDTVEIIHEALLSEWPRLRDWIDANRAWLATRDRLHDDAAAWDQTGRDPSRLYRGTHLAVTDENLTAALDTDLDSTSRAFLDASHQHRDAEQATETTQRARERRTTRRLRHLVAVLGVVILLTATATAFAYQQRRTALAERAVARSGQLATEATSLSSAHPNLARQLAVLAWTTQHSTEARQALFTTDALPVEAPLDDGPVLAIHYVGGRFYAATVSSSENRTVHLWDVPAPGCVNSTV